MSRARKIAAGIAGSVMMQSGYVGKSAGTRERLESAFMPGAKIIAKLEKRVNSNAARIRAEDDRWRAVAIASNGHDKNARFQQMTIPTFSPGLN